MERATLHKLLQYVYTGTVEVRVMRGVTSEGPHMVSDPVTSRQVTIPHMTVVQHGPARIGCEGRPAGA